MGVYNLHHDSGRSDRPAFSDDETERRDDNAAEDPDKVYVAVNADFSPRGVLIPRMITWENGRVYMIDRVLSMERRSSRKEGGAGMRYHCQIGRNSMLLYYETHGRWFVERKKQNG